MRLLDYVLPVALAGLAGCTMIPDYQRPEPPVPAAFPPAATDAAAAPPAAEVAWREFFTDPRLRSVIETALANNRDLRVAALTVDKVAALYRIQRSDLYPAFGFQATGERYRLPEKMTDGGEAEIVQQYSVNVGIASWELDLFGRVRSLNRAALEQFFATEQARSAAQISLVGAVAHAYLALAADQEDLRLAEATLESQSAYYALIARSRELGVASDLDLNQARSQVEVARLDAARFRGFVETDKNALTLLAGAPLEAGQLPDGLDTMVKPADIAAGLPSEVLLRRPDILMAEHRLLSSNANIGAARAAFFPRITLTLGGGTMSPDLSGLFSAGTGTWTFLPQITGALFAGGRQMAVLKGAKVERDIAVAQYEKAIQTAFREVADALALRDSLAAQQAAAEALVDALDGAYRLSNARYEAGVDGYLGVLVQQRALYNAQQGLVAIRMARLANQVTLYKVLGGGGSGGPDPSPGG
jgi:multidrug efflux system outer membrane protein